MALRHKDQCQLCYQQKMLDPEKSLTKKKNPWYKWVDETPWFPPLGDELLQSS